MPSLSTAISNAISNATSPAIRLWPIALAAVLGASCTGIAEDAATELAKGESRTFEQQLTVFDGDLALFRSCLSQRGGLCAGDVETPLPQTAQHATSTPIAPVAPGASPTLAQSVAALPPGHAAQSAHQVLQHSVTRQAAALHNALRGHPTPTADSNAAGADSDTDSSTPEITVEPTKTSDGVDQSTVTMHLHVDHARDFEQRLSASLGNGGWPALHRHCQVLVDAHGGAPADDPHLVSSCRQVAFIHGYLGAYIDHSHFFEVDVELAGTIATVQSKTLAVRSGIGQLQNAILDLSTVAESARGTATVASAASSSGNPDDQSAEAIDSPASAADLAGAVTAAAEAIDASITAVQPAVESRFGRVASTRLGALGQQIETQAARLSNAILSVSTDGSPTDVQTIAADLTLVLGQVDDALTELDSGVADLGDDLVQAIHDGLDPINRTLSNVFRVSNVGFVSRESTFTARLPSLEITLDPTARQLITVTDTDAPSSAVGTEITSLRQLWNSGVAADLSGVGTGSSIGAEVTRVFLEAIFDAQEGLPAIAPANAPGLQPSGLQLASGTPTGSTLGQYALPIYEAGPGQPVSPRDLGRILRINDLAALNTQLVAGRVVSGLGPFNLNNPPLEALITQMITTTVRKAMEKATWCWYACGLDIEKAKLDTAVESAVHDAIRRGEATIDSKIHTAAEDASGWVHREAERVRLRLAVHH